MTELELDQEPSGTQWNLVEPSVNLDLASLAAMSSHWPGSSLIGS